MDTDAPAPTTESTPIDWDTPREEMHTRRITLRGYRRGDGLYEVEARLSDRKPFDFRPASRDQAFPAEEAFHDHELRVVFDTDMVVRAVRALMHRHPYAQCPPGGDMLHAMVGVRIGAGWSTELRRRLPSGETCTHFKELMQVVATAALQTMVPLRQNVPVALDADGRPRKVDSCYAYGASRELVRQQWPAFHRPAPAEPQEQ